MTHAIPTGGVYGRRLSRSVRQRASQLGEDRQIGVQPNAVQSAHAKRRERPLVLETPELTLDASAATVERLEPLGLARDERVQTVCLDPRRSGLALGRGAAPLGCVARVVSPRLLAKLAARVERGQ
jgi:hypothetical protein